MLTKLCRFMLIVAWCEAAFATLLFVPMFWPMSGFVVAAAVAYEMMKRGKRLWVHGTAHFAGESALTKRNMLDSSRGLRIGRLVGEREPVPLWPLPGSWILNRSIDSRIACNRVLRHLASSSRKKRPVVRLANSIHTIIVGPTGAGKGASIAVPHLRESNESAVVIDFKGELAKLTARYREKMFRHCCVLLDLYRIVTKNPDRLNPLDFIYRDSPEMLDDCRDLSEQLVMKTGEEREPHWNQSAENWIAAAIAATVHFAPEGKRSLQAVRDILARPDKLHQLIELLSKGDGMLPRLGAQLAFFKDKELASTLTTANRHLRFLDTPAVWESTLSSSFDPRDLRKGKTTVYLILPPHHMRAQSALMRMWIGTLLRSVVQGGLQHGSNVNFILDEAASLGHMECIDDAIDKYRGYGVRLQQYFQAISQLKKCYRDGQDQTVLANCSQVFFGINDESADYVSRRLGDATVMVESGGTGSSSSTQISQTGQPSVTRSTNTNSNWSQMGRRLLKPEELYTLGERTAITFVPGLPPIMTTLERYYETKIGPQRWRRTKTVLATAFLFAAATVFAAVSCAMFLNVGPEQFRNFHL